eukprot:CCRYP_008709-RA/>CCRYP_008709-RA protein AED:0.43 eAED:0.43 QI:0/0/0/1/0/0/5/0/715
MHIITAPSTYNRMPLAPMGCAVQFHIKPDKRKTWGEHSMDGWYLKTSPEHYRCHIVFVKKTQAKRVTDTVFFKHKYITQPEVKPADVIIKAYNDLKAALQGMKNTSDSKQMRTLEAIQDQLSPGNKLQIEQQLQRRLPRVNNTKQAVPLAQSEPSLPRVQAEERRRSIHPMIVAPPQEQVVKSPLKPQPKPILKPPTHAAQEDSIAARLKARRAQQPSGTNITKADDESIAERLLRRKRQLNQTQAAFPPSTLRQDNYLNTDSCYATPSSKRPGTYQQQMSLAGIKGRVKATDTIKFIPKSDIPPDRLKDVTYIKFVCQVRTEKDEPNRTRATFGGNLIHYPDDVGTPTADLLLIKIFLNSVISTPGARFATADLSNFYLCTPMPRPEFGRVKLSDIPEEIIEEYKLRELATKDGWVYFRADKTHYGLPQAGSLSHDLLEKRLNAEGYVKTLTVPGLWKHKTRNIQFVLVVDDFGIKYVKKEDLDHLVGVLKRYYDASVDIHGKEFVKIELDWDYKKGEYQRKDKTPLTHILNQNTEQRSTREYDDSPDAGQEGQTHIQRVNGKFLWYGRAVDPTTLVPLSALASQQSKPTQNTMNKSQQFLDYMATQEPASCRSAAEAETGALYINARKAVEERNILQELGHKQPPTPIQTDNSTAEGIANNRVQPKRTKAMDMRFHWLRDRANQKQFRFYWRPGRRTGVITLPNTTQLRITET